MEETINVLINFRAIFVMLLMWCIIYAILITTGPFKESKNNINIAIATLAAIIVSLSGVVAYAVSYLFSLFGILIITLFVIALILNFLEIDIASLNLNGKLVGAGLGLVFLVIVVVSFFGLNNEFEDETFNNHTYQKDVNTQSNIGFAQDDETTINLEESSSRISDSLGSINSGVLSAFLLLLIMGVFVIVFVR